MTRPQVVLKPRRALPFFNRHPWVFSGAIARVDGDPNPGDVVDLRADDGQFIAQGLYNSHSNIRVRLYSWNEDATLDEAFWDARIADAIQLRRHLFPDAGPETAYRVIYSESDGLSGLVVDRYGDWLLVQLTSLALATRRDLLIGLLKERIQPAGIWLRTEKGIGTSEGLEAADGLIDGREPPRPLFLEEHGIRFGVDVIHGQKTGFYLDQRENRVAAAQYLSGKRVLDLFCYTGGFGLAAVLRSNAKSVLGVDVSQPAVEIARANAELNGVAEKLRFEASDVFEALERMNGAGERFGAVILDPPKMLRHRAGIEKALRGYHSLNRLAVDVLEPGGILVTCSCSGLVGRDDFEQMLSSVGARAGRPIQILEARGQAADHPVSVHCPETAYLKCYICRVG